MKKFIAGIGQSDFRSFREAGYSYVDKSRLISDILADPTLVLLFPRPRRFGKTISLSMLGYFLGKSKEDLSHLFEGLSVWQDERARKHFQRHPLISVSFKDVKADSFEHTLEAIGNQIARSVREHDYLLGTGKLDTGMTQRFQRILENRANQVDLESSFFDLAKALYDHHGERVVILIDEYDTPVQSGYLYDFFDKIVLFFRNFFPRV